MGLLTVVLLVLPIAIVLAILKVKYPHAVWLRVASYTAGILLGAIALLELLPEEYFDLGKLLDRGAGQVEPVPAEPTATEANAGSRLNPLSGEAAEEVLEAPTAEPSATKRVPPTLAASRTPPPALQPDNRSPLPETFPKPHYFSDLRDPSSDTAWPEREGDGGRAGYDGHGYVLHAARTAAGTLVLREMALYSDFALQVDATPLSAGDVTAYAVGFGWGRDDSGYLFVVHHNGRCALVEMEYGRPELVNENDTCVALRQNSSNRVLLIVEGEHFQGIVDGRVVLETEVDSDRGTRVALVVYDRQEGMPAEVRFNNLGVWVPPP